MEQTTFWDNNIRQSVPLAERMRPQVLRDFVGQKHLISDDSFLVRLIRVDRVGSCIFWGCAGTGKTTLANIIANSTQGRFVKLNAVSSGVADAKKVIDDAAKELRFSGKKTYLLLDECHRWSKAQSDCVLQAIENGTIIFIGSTTENPYVSMTPAIVSRCRVFEFLPLNDDEIKIALSKAVYSPNGFADLKITVTDDAIDLIAQAAAGDLRSAFNALELAVLTTQENADNTIVVNRDVAINCGLKKALSIDKNDYYDMISAFIKSMRGSDADGALFWFARLLEAGCDPLLLARRMVILASEDIGNADPLASIVATNALVAYTHIGMPEGRIILGNAVVYLCNCPKSNAAYMAIDSAIACAVDNPSLAVPNHLADHSYKRNSEDDRESGYLYPHSFGGYVKQQYLPDKLKDEVFYTPITDSEKERYKKIRNTDNASIK
ncbi:MAG: replication-associated recombination protein A [Clostridia bacterium]|nr:replication-associated recombination protein A [Clostridia bacterium]